MFWGTVYGLEVAGGYPWGFWAGPGYDFIKEGDERFVKKTQKIRDHARKLGIKLCHEIHPGTAAFTADDFLHLVKITDDDETMAVNADPSHCWEGESWESRFLKVGPYVYAAHIKNFTIRPGFPLRAMVSGPAQKSAAAQPENITPMALPDFTMRGLLEAGAHFGHQSHRWNPKMEQYIFGTRNNIHIIDLAQTVPLLHQALKVVSDTVAKGGRVLFVGGDRGRGQALRAILHQFALARRHADQLEDDLRLDLAAAQARRTAGLRLDRAYQERAAHAVARTREA